MHNLPQQALTYPPQPCRLRRGAELADPAHAGSAAPRGTKPRAAGRVRGTVPWRQAQRAAPQARRREGSMPNGRDGINGTGRSPRARRCMHRHALPMHIVAERQRPLIGKSSCQGIIYRNMAKRCILKLCQSSPSTPLGNALPWAIGRPDSIKSGCGIGARSCVLF